MIAGEIAPSAIGAYGDVAVWSTYDLDRRAYRLVSSTGGAAPVPLPVPERAVPFDVDLGPGSSGQLVAVYSRCEVDPVIGSNVFQNGYLPDPSTGRGCDVYRFDFGSHQERRVPGASRPDVSEYLPAIWRDRIVFARLVAKPDARRAPSARLYSLELDGRRRLSTVKPGAIGRPVFDGAGPLAVDLYGSRVAFVWQTVGRDCKGPESGVPFKDDEITDELFVQRLDGSERRRVAVACSLDATTVLYSPSLSAGRLTYVSGGPDTTVTAPRVVKTFRLANGTQTVAPSRSCLASAVRDGERMFTTALAECPGPQPPAIPTFEITRTGP